MSYPLHPDDWMTPEMARAENDLLNASWEAQREVERTDDLIDEIDGETVDLADEDVANFKKAVLTPPSPPEWKSVSTHVERGEFTWRDVIEGNASSHPDVKAAYEATAATRLVIDGSDTIAQSAPEEVKESEEVSLADDDYFDGHNFLDA